MQLDIKNDLKTVEQKARDCQNNTNTAHNLELIIKDSAIKLFSHSFIRQILCINRNKCLSIYTITVTTKQ